MAAPIIYTSTDPNAPVLCGQTGSLTRLLAACLVTGYGDKPAAGWTMPFADAQTDTAVFQNAGTGFCLRVSPSSATVAEVRGYEVMTTLDDGVFPFGAASGYRTVTQSSSSGTTPRPWILVADDRFFYFVAGWGLASWPITKTATTCSTLIFGDIVPYYQDDAHACVLGNTANAYYEYEDKNWYGAVSIHSGSASSDHRFFVARNIAATENNVPINTISPYWGSSPLGHSTVAANPAIPLIALPLYLPEKKNTAIFRGQLPGLHCTAPWSAPQFATGDIVTIGSDAFVGLTFNGRNTNYFASLLISTADWRA